MKILIASVFLGLACGCFAEADRLVRVDAEGVLRWNDDASEVALMGVNYHTPFTVDYAAIAKLGLDHKQVIRDDVAHFRRLGLGCIRIHCFDRQFSDSEGNLIDNAHLDLLDFVIDECRRSGLYTVLTPIAWWDAIAGKTHGFSDRHTMPQMTTDRQAWALQSRFLKQFVEHVNRYTGKRIAEDPCVLAFECINEPIYPKDTPDALVTEYINTLADALRAGGTTKPIYYNSWQGRNRAAGAARIDGVTSSSYPNGIASGRAKTPQLISARGSSLDPNDAIARKSRMVYEFDAADVAGSSMFPVMAKFFRSEGNQVASQFQYDPLPLASVNHNWMTHHLNLVYTPGKAISLAIAAEVFKRVPRGVTFGTLPEAADFPPFRSSAEADLSELVTDEAFLYSNSTATQPPNPQSLMRLWGCGSSPVVTYGGSGAYFLDRAAPGVWRLQLYPDVFTVADPYSGTTDVKVRVIPGRHVMTVRLPDLGDSFTVRTFDGKAMGEPSSEVVKGAIEVPPGDYLLTRDGSPVTDALLDRVAAVSPRYLAPRPDAAGPPMIRAEVAPQWRSGMPLTLRADAVSATDLTARLVSPDGHVRNIPMTPTIGTGYAANVPGDVLTPGMWRVSFLAAGPAGKSTFPRGQVLDIASVERVALEPALPLAVSDGTTPWSLFDVDACLRASDPTGALRRWRVTDEAGRAGIHLGVDSFSGDHDSAAVRVTCDGKGFAKLWQSDGERAVLHVRARAADPQTTGFELALIEADGVPWGTVVPLTTEWQTIRIPLGKLTLFSQWGKGYAERAGPHLRLSRLEAINICFGKWLFGATADKPHAVEIAEIGVTAE